VRAGPETDLAGWTPIRLYREGDRTLVDWCETGPTRFVDPFFHQTIDRVLARPAVALFRRQTPVEVLEALAHTEPGLAPAGFIFHGSRCGSTLVTQMLAASDTNRVLSEPGPIDEVLRTGFRAPIVPEAMRLVWLRAMVSALGRSQGSERRLFIKFDPWHVLALPLIRKAFPEVPWVMLVRDPLEILVAQSRSFGTQFPIGPIPPEPFDIDLVSAASTPPDACAGRVLDRIFKAAATHFDNAGLVVDYRELPDALGAILAHFGVDSDERERAVMAATAAFDAKMPNRIFLPDSETKRAAADNRLQATADGVRPAFDQVLRLRDQGHPVTAP
jgi:hypothetical protein